jgi:hypothetical protein
LAFLKKFTAPIQTSRRFHMTENTNEPRKASPQAAFERLQKLLDKGPDANMPEGFGSICVEIDEQSLMGVDEMIANSPLKDMAWKHYLCKAINNRLTDLRRPSVVFLSSPDITLPYVPLKFRPGKHRKTWVLDHIEVIDSAAKQVEMTRSAFVLDALQRWASIPKGMGID